MLLLNARSIRNKLDDLETLMSESNPDVVAVTETWLTPDISDCEIAISGYNLERADRLGAKPGGGVAVFSRESLTTHSSEAFCDADGAFESIWLRINNGKLV